MANLAFISNVKTVKTKEKLSKSEVSYTPNAAHKNERCGLCTHYISPGGCEIVAGLINPEGWCKRFKAK